MKVIWKPVNYKNLQRSYLVSNTGKVKSLHTNTIIHGTVRKDGYIYFHLTRKHDRKRIKISAHRLVAMAFIANPKKKPFVNHKDGCKSNNISKNLEWVTASENLYHAYKLGLTSAVGSSNNLSKLDEKKGQGYTSINWSRLYK